MKLKCAACGASASLDVMITHDGAREALLIAFEMPAPLGKLLVQYLALHRPKERDLSFDRVATLLGSLLPMIQAGQIEHKKKTWSAPHAAWLAAIEQTLSQRDKLTLPLKGHGYLLSIIAGLGERTEATAEAKREENRRQREQGQTAHGEEKKRSPMPPEVRQQLARLTGRMRPEASSQAPNFDHNRNATLKALEAAQEASTKGEP